MCLCVCLQACKQLYVGINVGTFSELACRYGCMHVQCSKAVCVSVHMTVCGQHVCAQECRPSHLYICVKSRVRQKQTFR